MDRPPNRQAPRRRVRPSGGALMLVVVGWWLLLGGAFVWLVREPTVLATTGQTARIHRPTVPAHPVAANRSGLDAFQRSIRENDEGLREEAYVVSMWFAVSHDQLVKIIAVDGDAIQVELLEGLYAGRHAWLTTQDLRLAQ